jgi:glycosyltransferase involved in cell wall biosynthesis
MKITVVTSIYPPDIGGPATYAAEIKARLSGRGHEVKVVTVSTRAAPGDDVRTVPVKNFRPAPFRYLWNMLVFLWCVIRVGGKSDVVYTLNPAYTGLVGWLGARLLRKKIVVRMVGDAAWEEASNRRLTRKFLDDFMAAPEGGRYIRRLISLQRFVFRHVDRIIVPSGYLKNVLVRYYGIEDGRIKVVYNSIDFPPDSLPEKPDRPAPLLVTVGRLARHKRVDAILRVTRDLQREFPGLRLSVVGDGPERGYLEELTDRLELGDRVMFHGRTAHDRTMELIAEADVFILNSVYEGLPHVALEAMACRTPVVATDIPGTSEAVLNGETGLLVPPDDDAALQEGVTRLLRDGTLREALVEKAYRRLLDTFTWDHNLAALEKVLEDVA